MKDEIQASIVETTGAAIGTKTAYAGGVTSVVGAMSQVNWIGWLGLLIALIGAVISFYYSYKKDKREQIEHELKVKQLIGDKNGEK